MLKKSSNNICAAILISTNKTNINLRTYEMTNLIIYEAATLLICGGKYEIVFDVQDNFPPVYHTKEFNNFRY